MNRLNKHSRVASEGIGKNGDERADDQIFRNERLKNHSLGSQPRSEACGNVLFKIFYLKVRLYVSFIWTSHGSTRRDRLYSASRSFCRSNQISFLFRASSRAALIAR
jgi:hypothetical protein